MTTNTFSTVLIANRGEIACRVIRTAKDKGYRTVAVFSEADAGAPHVALADKAVCIGAAPVGESYLSIANIMEAIKLSGADAVHPGYGFLSENAEFAAACAEAGVVFIGPPSSAVALMGSKRESKIAMQAAGVPCIPGYQGAEQDDATLLAEAERVGFPLMVKASAGGGGRGMRLVMDNADLAEQIRSARSEATSAFGSGELILERAILEPRHVEIQVFADQQGNVVYLGERDCSIQRRHQKVVEEAPSPAVDETLRQRMGEAAVLAAKSCNYVGAGTVEFLLDKDGQFYFLEMNTRLQVEHPVTELITGTDLVAWQLDIAAGKPLPLQQNEITLTGHAMEVRLYAEDATNNFMPQTGLIQQWQPATGAGVRVDDGIVSGQEVTPFYDPMLAKVIAWGADREEARRRLIRAVEDSQLTGVHTNKHWLASILKHQNFAEGEATTAFLEHFGQEESLQAVPADLGLLGLAGLLLRNPQAANNWRSTGSSRFTCELTTGENKYALSLTNSVGDLWQVNCGEESAEFSLHQIDGTQCICTLNGVRQSIYFTRDKNEIWLDNGRGCYQISNQTLAPAQASAGQGSGDLRASMDGLIVDVLVNEGDTVIQGQTLVVLEAMKMEHPLKAGCDGTVASLNVNAGEQVKLRQLLVTVAKDDNEAA
ncbi:acetyl/propionyl/methylcrotonyl-CoA carboxylase subunit alpha [Parendozoicomonas haliclonae]|uniref:Biotin carboxylase n=1 Tax=Parendozoicomonas haliclonae TaxID=1960125 RepID=A0A1X7AH43_9GAMM|nr:acetyl/propionyl/methylcrotonyl-CoA carboxylase subunit alpha [Parendozoicomonas haliclonae]SMA34874.1 Acetyl-/propionyl-coenzyme A carboxylase alpha chain [Parendozoicomonas haliclonae]